MYFDFDDPGENSPGVFDGSQTISRNLVYFCSFLVKNAYGELGIIKSILNCKR